MAEAILELDADTRMDDGVDIHATPSRLASKVVKVSQDVSSVVPQSEDSSTTASKKKLAVENAKRRKEEKRGNTHRDPGSSNDVIGVAPDRGGIGTGAVVEGVPPPYPAPANFTCPKRKSSPRGSRSKSPSHVRRSPRRRYSSSRSRSPVRSRRSRSPYSRRWSPVRWDRYSRNSRSPRRWSPRRSDRGRWERDLSPPRRYHDQGSFRDDRPWSYGDDRVNPAWNVGPPGPPSRGFEEHGNAWGRAPAHPPPSLLPIPEELSRSNVPVPTDDTLDLLKREMLGLSQTVKSLSSQLSSEKRNSKMAASSTENSRSVPKISEATSTPPAGVHGKQASNPSKADEIIPGPSTKSSKKKKAASVPVSINLALLEPDSEIDTPVEESSSEDEERVESGAESPEEDKLEYQVDPTEGILDWPELVSLIVGRFEDRIGPEPKSPEKARISNLGGMVSTKTTERTRLPLYYPIQKALNTFPKDIRYPAVKARSKKDAKPLGRGSFPSTQRNLPLQAISGMLHFNHPAQVEAEVDQLLPSGKTSFNVQGRLTEEHLRNLERDMRANLSSLSYVLWNLDFASSNLKELSDESPDADMLTPALSACRHAMSFLSTVLDRSSTSLATTILARRDSYLAQMDPLLKEEARVNLRCASFSDSRLFSGEVASVLPGLDSLRKDSKERESVNALASLAKRGVEKQGSSFDQKKKKKEKKFSKKKGGGGQRCLLYHFPEDR